MKEKISFDDVISEIKDDEIVSRPYHRLDGRKVNDSLMADIACRCMAFGVKGDTVYGKNTNRYRLILNYNLCKLFGSDLSIFHGFYKDAILDEKRIFINQIPDKQECIKGNHKIYFVIILHYKNEDEMIQDMISAANYIQENLDAEKNKDN